MNQAGLRSGFLQAIVLLVETCAEYNLELWVCAVDFRKTFDSIEHGSIWNALRVQEIEEQCIGVLAL